MVNTDISVENLTYWIERATTTENEGQQFDSWDKEYATDNLNKFYPGLGDYVGLLRRDKPIGDAEFYRRALATMYNVLNLLTFKDESVLNEINEAFSFILTYKGAQG